MEGLNMKATTVERIRGDYGAEPSAKALEEMIGIGWPGTRSEVPNEIQAYFPHCDELTVDEGIVLKGAKMVIPPSLQKEMVEKTHYSHIGIGASLRRAQDVLFWPGMAAQIREFVLQCPRRNERRPAQPKEPLQNHAGPAMPWSRIAMDLFSLDDSEYVIMVDSYSDYREIDQLSTTTIAAVIKACKRQFARHGIPSTVIANGGPQ